MTAITRWLFACVLLLLGSCARADDLAWGDPANAAAPPAGAVGWPSREANLDALPGFQSPPPGYGEVAFYWWLGDPLTKERLTWQLDQLDRVKGVMGLQVNYAHSDRGGRSYGLTYASDPPLFSPAWWKLFQWLVAEGKKRGMSASLSDYTLGTPGQGWWADEILAEDPAMCGSTLSHQARDVAGGSELTWDLPEGWVGATAYRVKDGRVVPGSDVDLCKQVAGGSLRWTAPAGSWRAVLVAAQAHPLSLDPMNPRCGKSVIEKFFQRFEDHCPGEGGRGLDWFFSDELNFGVGGNLWNRWFAEEFRRRKGYDVVPELPALFLDVGPRTPKVRLDYADVMVRLCEAGYFRPLFDWHASRGMIYGCDHGGRGRNVTEFGDYFLTQRWMPGPGCDSPGLSSDVIKNKVASSIAHLYQRPRVWNEGFHSSGWSTNSAQLTDAVLRNFVQGHNLLTLHGLYYSTHGGWWEWAPPCNHFRMPYWAHMREFFAMVQRLSYLMSQGVHHCDVAIVYPVAPCQAGMEGSEAVSTAFGVGQQLYGQGIDFDFIDFESLARAKVAGGKLCVSGEEYRVLVLPAMRAVRFSTVGKAAELARGGGLVVNVGALPEASDRAGRDDAELNSLVRGLFGSTGAGKTAQSAQQAAELIGRSGPRDFALLSVPGGAKANPMVMHRKIGPRDVYMIYGAPKDALALFRVRGRAELWDPWTGGTRPLEVASQTAEATRLRLPLEAGEAELIVFSPGRPQLAANDARPREPSTVALEGEWEFELAPVLDNRFGDFHWPPTQALLGAEARQFRYAEEASPQPGWQAPGVDDSRWPKVTYTYGRRFWRLGPLPEAADAPGLEERLAAAPSLDAAAPVVVDGKPYRWRPYAFSTRFGVEGDPGHQGYHGLKEQVDDRFIALGKLRESMTNTSREKEEAGGRNYLWTTVWAERDGPAQLLVGGQKPSAVWLNGTRLAKLSGAVNVKAGANPVLLRFDAPGRGYVVFTTGPADPTEEADGAAFSPAACWIWSPGKPLADSPCFRKKFALAQVPVKAVLRITCDNGYTVHVNGREVGQGSRWERIQQYDVVALLAAGSNAIAAVARNEGDSAGLIAELTITGPDGKITRLSTDATWRCRPAASEGWLRAGFDDSAWAAAMEISRFEGSLWATHPTMGPPKLDEHTAAEGPQPPAVQPLATRWHTLPGLLPYDVRPQQAHPAGWYRFASPPGLRGMTIVAHGSVQAWADGKPLTVEAAGRRADGSRAYLARVAEPSPGSVAVAVRIEQDRGLYGGAALPEPIVLDCVPGRIALCDWSQIDGLACYSGGAWYRRTVALSAEQIAGRVTLDLGNLVSSAEVRVNGRPAGVRVAPPWKFDVTKLVRPGENRVEVLVYNTVANHYLTIPTRYRGSPLSGLLGPVTIQSERPTMLGEK